MSEFEDRLGYSDPFEEKDAIPEDVYPRKTRPCRGPIPSDLQRAATGGLIKKEATMATRRSGRGRMIKHTTWTTGRGDEIDITDMSDSHLLNTVAYLQSKKERLERTEFECGAIDQEVKNINEYIEIFVDELNDRDKTGKHIEWGYYE